MTDSRSESRVSAGRERARFVMVGFGLSEPGTMGGNTKIALEIARNLRASHEVHVVVPANKAETVAGTLGNLPGLTLHVVPAFEGSDLRLDAGLPPELVQDRTVEQIQHGTAGIRGVPPAMLMFGYRLVTALVAIFAFFPLARKFLDAPGIPSRVLAFLGQASLGIYAVHMVIRFPLAAFLHRLLPNLPYAPLMLLVFASLLSISILLVRILSRFRPASSLLLGKL